MKVETCVYSGYKIHPGHGKRVVRIDGKTHIFLSSKCERGWKLKRNPRDITWTVLYRRKHKKGVQAEELSKRKTRRVVKFHRAIGNTTLEAILAKRNQKPEFRKKQREEAVKAAKEKQRAKAAVKQVEKQKDKQKAPKQKAAKPMKTTAPRVGGKR